MPRTQRSAEPKFSIPTTLSSAFQIDSATCSTDSSDFAHALFAPLHYESGYAYPLIVWLHGPGTDERQLQRVMPLVSMRNYVAVAPRGIALPNDDKSATREQFGWRQTEDHIQQAEQRVFDAIELASQKLHIASHRIFLVGFDAGGTMALRIAFDRPDRIAGVASICGALPMGHSPLGHYDAARHLWVLMASGRASVGYSAEQVCEDLRLLHAAGISTTLRQYPCGQELMPQMLADLNRWIIEQLQPQPTAADAI
jgi:phospholipase/carboxylesterase